MPLLLCGFFVHISPLIKWVVLTHLPYCYIKWYFGTRLNRFLSIYFAPGLQLPSRRRAASPLIACVSSTVPGRCLLGTLCMCWFCLCARVCLLLLPVFVAFTCDCMRLFHFARQMPIWYISCTLCLCCFCLCARVCARACFVSSCLFCRCFVWLCLMSFFICALGLWYCVFC